MEHVERFAPSPTGRLHLGHAFSAIAAFEAARAAGGRFLLRIEDIDAARSRREHEAAIFDDLAWLGLRWETPVPRQSARMPAYAAALKRLEALGLLYPCACTRADIAEAMSAPQEGASVDGPLYPGLCRGRRDVGRDGRPVALRLDMARALTLAPRIMWFDEIGEGPSGETGRIPVSAETLLAAVGDVALARKDVATSYHLSVVVDDAWQGVSHVTRGQDLFAVTALHRLLQALLRLPTPVYRHHRLIRDASGRRLAKRDDARALSALRAEGATPQDVRRMIGL